MIFWERKEKERKRKVAVAGDRGMDHPLRCTHIVSALIFDPSIHYRFSLSISFYPTQVWSLSLTMSTLINMYETVATVPESWVRWRAVFQSGSRVLKKVLWTFSYLYLWYTVWFHAKKLLTTFKFWKSLNLAADLRNHQKTTHSNRITQMFLICMV